MARSGLHKTKPYVIISHRSIHCTEHRILFGLENLARCDVTFLDTNDLPPEQVWKQYNKQRASRQPHANYHKTESLNCHDDLLSSELLYLSVMSNYLNVRATN